MPKSVAIETPGRSSTSSRVVRATARSAGSGTSPETAIPITGIVNCTSLMAGSSAPSGRSGFTRSTAVRTSASARPMSVPTSSVAVQTHSPSTIRVETSSTRSTVATARSTWRATPFSTSSGVAPG